MICFKFAGLIFAFVTVFELGRGCISRGGSSSSEEEDDSEDESLPHCEAEELPLDDDPSCPDEFPSEIYRDLMHNSTLLKLVCCKPGTSGETQQKLAARNCRATECLSSSDLDDDQDNLCAKLPIRLISNVTLSYQEVTRESCTNLDNEPGHVALCCRPNSIEQVLISLLGAEPNEFPHQVRIQPVGCGGTIYNKRYVITAAHCVIDYVTGLVDPAEASYLSAGTNIEDMDANTKEYIYKVKSIKVHEKFSLLASNPRNERGKSEPRYLYDIALLKTDKDFRFSAKIQALELAPQNFDPFRYSDKVVAVGWGATENLQGSSYLAKTNLILRRDKDCFKSGRVHAEYEKFQSQLLCAGGIMDGKFSFTAGSGDSGGPAICKSPSGNPVICGITSFGGLDDECHDNGDEESCIPSVFTEASYFSSWIVKNAGKQDENTFLRYPLYGEDLKSNEYPHQVHITSNQHHSCGGTLIKSNLVITAAHCVYQFKSRRIKLKENLAVWIGKSNANEKPGESILVKAGRHLPRFKRLARSTVRLRHKDRAIRSDEFYKNDLAVILLERNSSFNAKHLPRLSAGEACSYKYGVEITFPKNPAISGRLERHMNLLKHEDCLRRFKLIRKTQIDIKLKPNSICGLEKYSGGSVCDLEVGGGLICTEKNQEKVLCGVQIFRLCMFSVPNLFIDVSLYRDWIEQSFIEMMD